MAKSIDFHHRLYQTIKCIKLILVECSGILNNALTLAIEQFKGLKWYKYGKCSNLQPGVEYWK